MKKVIKAIALGVIFCMMFACASQKEQTSNTQRPSGRKGGAPNFSQLLAEMDTNKDGKLSKSEVQGPLQRDFATIDSNDDGFITKVELENAPKPERGQRLPRG